MQLLISQLDVHRAVEKVGVNQYGVLNLPVNSWNAGWYKGGPVPGAPGDSVIEGHAGYPGQPMIFGKLVDLHTGDRIVVVLADGSHRLFLVESMRSVPAGSAIPGLAEPYGKYRDSRSSPAPAISTRRTSGFRIVWCSRRGTPAWPEPRSPSLGGC